MHIAPNFINGKWIATREYSANINPSNTKDVVGRYSRASEDDVAHAVESAKRSLAAWAAAPVFQRAAILHKIANDIRTQQGRLAELLAREEGKTLREAGGEIARAANTFDYYAYSLQKETGQTYDSVRPGVRIHTRRRPVGVVAVITPWNFPFAVPAWKIAPALAYGNSVVFKPAEVVSASGWALTEIISNSGLPDGVFNLVMGSGRLVGGVVAGHPDVNAITFTGSTNVGQHLLLETHKQSNARVQTELGGKNGLIVLDDANLELAIESILDSAFAATGQRCTASSRIIATRGVYPELAERLSKRVSELRVGDALNSDTDIGPVAHEDQLNTDLDYLEIGQKEGAELLVGGELVDLATKGHFLQPALFVGGTSSMRINQEEIFGPIACMIEAQDVEDAVEILNDSDYGLSAGIITQSLGSSEYFQSHAQAGLLTVNDSPAASEHHVPFGGIKDSGHGPREQGTAAIEFFTDQTTHFVRSL